ncbi:MAG: HXXEE domain-containing protein [Solirubrobacteraceae bacterium]
MSLLDRYRDNWPRVGGLIALGGAGALTLTHRRMSKPRLLSAMNLLALLVHQYEEYQDPGYFPGQFNGGLFHSDQPDHYPLNTNIALIINVPLAYGFYVLPVVFPKKRWLGLAPVLFGFGQAAGHGLIFNRLAKDRYSPGFLASLFLHVPIGIQYLRALREEGPIEHADWSRARMYMIAFAASSVAGPNIVLRDKNSPYKFTAKQVGRHTAPTHD